MLKNKKDNLKKPQSSNEARRLGAIGGRKSGEVRRKKRAMREYMEALLESQQDGISGAEALALALFEKALGGDVKAHETIMASVGQAPRQTVPPVKLPEMTTAADLPKMTRAILHAVAAGTLTPAEGQSLSALAVAHGKAVEVAELEKRIAALEQGKRSR